MALGRAYAQTSQWGRASRLLGSVDASSLPAAQQAAFYQIRGQAKFKSNNNAGAIADLEKAIATENVGYLSHYYLGQAYSSNQQYRQAETHLKHAQQRASNPQDLKGIWKQLGFAYEKQKKYAQSIEAYQNAGSQADVRSVKGLQRRG